MKIATTTGDFHLYCKSDEERIRELHRAGFRYIDLNMYRFTPDCAYMQQDWKKEVAKIKNTPLTSIRLPANASTGNLIK